MLVSGPALAQDGLRPTRAIVAQAAAAGVAIPPGPFAPTWDSLRTNYVVSGWFRTRSSAGTMKIISFHGKRPEAGGYRLN